MNPLRIVTVMIEPPVPFGNAASRWFYVLLKGLVERGHQVTAFATCSNRRELEAARDLFPPPVYDLRLSEFQLEKSLRRKWASVKRPYSYPFGPELQRELATELSRGVDLLHLEHLWSGWLGLAHARQAVVNVHYLFDIDLSARPATDAAGWARRFVTSRAERYLLRHYPQVMTLSPRLSQRVNEISPSATVHTIPLGLDISLYPYNKRANDWPAVEETRTPVLGLIGSFNWEPTYSAGVRLLTRLWPQIKARVPNAQLRIVGRQARKALNEFTNRPDVNIIEDVPDIFPYFTNLDVLLYAPGRGSGMKVKVLEAFAFGVSVVTTSEGVEGIPAVDGLHAGICDDDEGLIERTVTLLSDPSRRAQQSWEARKLLEAHCSPEVTLNRLENIYKRVLGVTPANGRSSYYRLTQK